MPTDAVVGNDPADSSRETRGAVLAVVACSYCEHNNADHGRGECRYAGDVICRRCSQQKIEDHERSKQ